MSTHLRIHPRAHPYTGTSSVRLSTAATTDNVVAALRMCGTEKPTRESAKDNNHHPAAGNTCAEAQISGQQHSVAKRKYKAASGCRTHLSCRVAELADRHLGQEEHADTRLLNVVSLDIVLEQLPGDCSHHARSVTAARGRRSKNTLQCARVAAMRSPPACALDCSEARPLLLADPTSRKDARHSHILRCILVRDATQSITQQKRASGYLSRSPPQAPRCSMHPRATLACSWHGHGHGHGHRASATMLQRYGSGNAQSTELHVLLLRPMARRENADSPALAARTPGTQHGC